MSERIPTEHEEQRAFVQWFRQTHPGVRIFAIPNGGARNIATAARLKSEGVCAGVPDLFIPAWRLWVEMKRTKGGSLSKEQKDWIAYLQSAGMWAIVGIGCDDAIKKTQEFKHEKRGEIGVHDAANSAFTG
jgi:hypothetical protein